MIHPMNDNTIAERIRSAHERNARALELRPALGQKTVKTVARVVDGLRCEIQEGRWTIVSDASDKSGGTGAGPDPAALSRLALGACLAMGYATWAARMHVALDAIEVELQSDFDARGQYGMEGIRPAHSEIRYHVRITSSAPREDVQKVLDKADSASMVLDAFAHPQTCVRHVEIRPPE